MSALMMMLWFTGALIVAQVLVVVVLIARATLERGRRGQRSTRSADDGTAMQAAR